MSRVHWYHFSILCQMMLHLHLFLYMIYLACVVASVMIVACL